MRREGGGDVGRAAEAPGRCPLETGRTGLPGYWKLGLEVEDLRGTRSHRHKTAGGFEGWASNKVRGGGQWILYPYGCTGRLGSRVAEPNIHDELSEPAKWAIKYIAQLNQPLASLRIDMTYSPRYHFDEATKTQLLPVPMRAFQD